ncbi:palmitoyltransferase akr1 [Rhizina undulata]
MASDSSSPLSSPTPSTPSSGGASNELSPILTTAGPSTTGNRHGVTTPQRSPQRHQMPPFTPPKGPAVAPTVDTETVELKEMINSEPPTELPLKDDILKLSMLGDEVGIRALLESGKVKADWRDDEGVGPLHWAAINNRYAVCKLLIEAGADVNAKGGESVATPAMWAAQRGHYYIVNLMLVNGADPLLTDVHGYNLLHLATFDGNLFLLVVLLHQGIPVDVPDRNEHTSLMWAAYKGFHSSVDLFLRWGADIHAVDDNGFTALHWALVRGNFDCISKLIEYGADRFVKNNDGKSPAMVAEELKTQRVWHDALRNCGYDKHGNYLHPTGSILGVHVGDKTAILQRFFFLWPTAIVWAVITCFSKLPWFFGIPAAVFVAAGMHIIAAKALDWTEGDMKAMYKTPYLAGIFAGTAFWVGERWMFTILPNTFAFAPFSNVLFAFFFGFCLYFYAICMIYDPGFVPKQPSVTGQKAIIEELLSLWKYDDRNFCVQCMVRMPLRSKHCKRCGRCVAKHDHHCPWVFNCIGVKNHRQFFMYIMNLEIGIFLFIRLALIYFSVLPPVSNPECSFLAEPFCSPTIQDPFTVYLTAWSALQTTWVTMLLIVQLVQIARAQTAYESMHRSRRREDTKYAAAVATAIAGGSTSFEGAQVGPSDRGSDPAAHRHGGRDREGCFSRCKKLLGIDAFVHTAQDARAGGNRRREPNPFSRGLVTNCKDFWCDPSPLLRSGGSERGGRALLGGEGVDYFHMYETPPRMRFGRDARGMRYQRIGDDEEV